MTVTEETFNIGWWLCRMVGHGRLAEILTGFRWRDEMWGRKRVLRCPRCKMSNGGSF